MAEKISVELHDPVSGPPAVTVKTWATKESKKPLDTLIIDMRGLLWKPRKTAVNKDVSKKPRRRYWSEFDDMVHDYDPKTDKPDKPTDVPLADKITVMTEISPKRKAVEVKAYYRGVVVGTLKVDNEGIAWFPRNYKVRNVYAWEKVTELVDALKPKHRR